MGFSLPGFELTTFSVTKKTYYIIRASTLNNIVIFSSALVIMSAVNKLYCLTLECSSLHCNISLSFCLFSYNGIFFDGLNLSVSDVIVSQKKVPLETESFILVNVCVRYKGTKS